MLASLDCERCATEKDALTDMDGEVDGFDHGATAARRLQELEAERALPWWQQRGLCDRGVAWLTGARRARTEPPRAARQNDA